MNNPSQESVETEGISPKKVKNGSYRSVLMLAYQSLGVVYGDLSTSPLYVYKTTFSGKLSLHENDEEIYGVLSFIFWTFTLIALFKYVFIVMSADDNGEGGTFALYSLLCRHARLCILPNQEPIDDQLSAYDIKGISETRSSAALKSFFRLHPSFRRGFLLFVLFGTCMAIGDGVLTPAISVLSAVSGVKHKITGLHDNYIVLISCVLLVGLFSLQHRGTHKVAFMFAPIITAWLVCISVIGMYNIIKWNPSIYHALSPVYMLKFLRSTGVEGWISLGGVVLSITGVEAMFADLGHFSSLSIKIAFTLFVYPSLILAYLGEAAFLSKHHEDIQRSFYRAIPGLAVTFVMFVSTCLMTLVIIIVWKLRLINAIAFLMFFGSIELLYISASIIKVHEGGWIPLVLSTIFMCSMYAWYYGTMKKHEYDDENKVSMNRILSSGPSLGIVRVPGIGLIYTNLVAGVPAVFGHFVTTLPAFHQVLVFVCIKYVQVPHINEEDRLLVTRVGPKECSMFRCIVRYGYRDLLQENYNFENRLVFSLVHYVETEDQFWKKPMTEVSRGCENSKEPCEYELPLEQAFRSSNKYQAMDTADDDRGKSIHNEEAMEILRGKESGITYIFGHCSVKAKKSSSIFKKLAIDIIYAFLNQNCREQEVLLNVPHTSLLEVGMVYYV
ncbi:potassium transporter 1 isoform X3 [Cucumis sativus]|uniref:Potassium transporter n=1 Tax=Cucumis sativus TaxID=3659 RepID=A0A0A0M0V0_CUCSA|nr:potassium transporter 1 isoform X3 [Cucumis sativus]